MAENKEKTSGAEPNLMTENQTSQNDADTEWQELMGKDLRMKVVQSGESNEPEHSCDVGDAVRVDFVGYAAKNTDSDDWEEGEVFQHAKDWLVIVVEKDVMPALEMGIRFLHLGDRAIIQSHSKYAYGPAGRKHGDYVLPPHSSVIYQVHIKAIIKGESKEYSTHKFQIQCAQSKKMIGNDCYKNEWSDGFGKAKALQLYRKGAEGAKRVLQTTDDQEEKEQARQVLVDCLNNSTAVHMKAKDYKEAKEAATQVLMNDPRNLRGLCRAARATMLDPASSYTESDAAISAAEKEYPDDADVKKLRTELERRKHDYNKKSKAMMSKMAKAMKSEKRENKDNSMPVKEAEKPASTEDNGLERSTAEDDMPWWKKHQHKLAVHGIILLFQICFLIYLKSKDLLMTPGANRAEPVPVQEMDLDNEF